MLETHMKLCPTELDFSEKIFFALKMGEMAKNGPKTGFFAFIGKLSQ